METALIEEGRVAGRAEAVAAAVEEEEEEELVPEL